MNLGPLDYKVWVGYRWRKFDGKNLAGAGIDETVFYYKGPFVKKVIDDIRENLKEQGGYDEVVITGLMKLDNE